MPTYSDNIKKMITRRSFDLLFGAVTYSQSNSENAPVVARASSNTSITIYSGTQPTAQDIETNWTNYNQSSSICLAHYSSGPAWSYNSATMTYYFTNTSNTITTNALRSGTAAWAIIWKGNSVNINVSILPNSGKFIVVPVSLNSSIGIIRYTDLTTTTGQPFIPYDGGLSISE